MLVKGDFVHLQPGGSLPVPPVGLGGVSLRIFTHALRMFHVPMTAGCCHAHAMQNPLAEKNTEPGFFWKTSLPITRKMRLGLAELGDNSEQLLPGPAGTAGLLGGVLCPPLFSFCLLRRIRFPLALPFLPPFLFPIKSLSSVCPHLHCPAVMKAGSGSEGIVEGWEKFSLNVPFQAACSQCS